MKLLLINPCLDKKERTLSDFSFLAKIADKQRLCHPLSLVTVAALTPPSVDVKIVDEEIEPIDFNEDAELIGITAFTCQAKRAYEIAQGFRAKKKHVVMGGIHASMLPQEALQYVDTVVVGEAESIWAKVIEDFQNNGIQRLYQAEIVYDLDSYPVARRDLLQNKAYITYMVQTKRGCPHNCKFCSVKKFNGRKVRFIGPEKVRQEIEQIVLLEKENAKSKKNNLKLKDETGRIYDGVVNLFITDDNFIINKKHVQQICSVIQELSMLHNMKILWTTHADINLAKDEEMLTWLSESGCIHVFIGFESLENENLQEMQKNCKAADDYSVWVEKIHSFGIDVFPSFVVGSDHDTPESLDKILEFTEQNGLYYTTLSALTPYPGTDLFDEWEKENRILCKDWEKYNFHHILFQPKNMTPEELRKTYHSLLCRMITRDSLYQKLAKREEKKVLLLEPVAPKGIFIYVTLVQFMKKMREEGMPWKEILPILLETRKYLKKKKKLSFVTVQSIVNILDELHYIFKKKSLLEKK
ncbi:MAG: B12-binding domain-containing radical SAM protein [Candidatus Brocadiae bacterium]|nr:B12-binding domain-containing radical SAM protein [Candidatus Brocadiia bacterium]